MSSNWQERKAEHLNKVIQRITEKLPADIAQRAIAFTRQYYQWVAPEDLIERATLDLYGAALSHWNFAQKRTPSQRLLHVYNPRAEEHGWQSTHTVIEIVLDDMPFLVDSLTMELSRLGIATHLFVHPVMGVQRDGQGQLQAIVSRSEQTKHLDEAILHIEVDRQTSQEQLSLLEKQFHRVLDQIHLAVEDWTKMRERLHGIVDDLRRQPPNVLDKDALAEDVAFLDWLGHDHFTFLGFREYSLVKDHNGDESLHVAPNSGLGILRSDAGDAISKSFAHLPPQFRKLAHKPDLLIISKSNTRSAVHRPGYMDYVGIKRFDTQGNVVGEWRFLGLYTSAAYITRPVDIPLVRRKVANVLQRADFRPKGHSAKTLANILETLPRDELFQSTEDELYTVAIGILHLQERPRVCLFTRQDTYGRFVSCLVFLPRERFNTHLRMRVQEILRRSFQATIVDFSVALAESPLARLYFIVHTEPGTMAKVDLADISDKITEAARVWEDDFHAAIIHELGEDQGNRLFAQYRHAFPTAYRDEYAASVAVSDIARMEELSDESSIGMSLYQPLEIAQGMIRFKLFRCGHPIHLSAVLPMLENMGVRVIDERPHEIKVASGRSIWIHDLGIAYENHVRFDNEQIRQLFQDAFRQVWLGKVENDGFNKLVLTAQLPWRSVVLLRACCKYLRQTGFSFSQTYIEQALHNHPQIAALFVDLFGARFDPQQREQSLKRIESITDAISHSLDAVPNLDEDRIQRRFLLLIQSMLRTNFFQTQADGETKDYISFKLDPSHLPDLPEPRPQFEIFVYARHMEGIHLRGGKVARGGLRWSDRLEDFRTEVFHLMKTQTVKNTVIVPVGAKGGFVVKQPPQTDDRDALAQEVKHCYRTLIRGLLDITDNLAGDKVLPPPDVVRYDGDDPYLVVAADKGTASFSDIANGIAKEYKFWLGDAFASGGSAGYDHKKMAITARGGWESAKRFFREMGIDIQRQAFTVIGIGGMSGDVFGNGMLLSRHIKLIGAFSHSHIFIDPNPDTEVSFRERERLFALPRSNWTDYDKKIISKGGGIFARSAKAIPISAEARQALGITAETLPPNELIRALLQAPVDLLWNGGIGTFVKARHQTHADAGDRSNDALRINADELRCRVIGEGGNLGLTAAARIEYALRGGRINTDFVDNSAGVDCSDHEVNIKILLDDIVKRGDLSDKQRNQLLVEMTEDVANIVLVDNYQQTQVLSLTEYAGAANFDELYAYLKSLESAGRIERSNWSLPTHDEVSKRRGAGQYWSRPELAVLMAYSKMELYDNLLASDICEDEYLSQELSAYFPSAIQQRFGALLQHHRLRRELIATCLTNNIINRMGITFPFNVKEDTGAKAADVARAYVAARNIFDMTTCWQGIEALDNQVEAKHQLAMLDDTRCLVQRATLWFLRNRKQPLDINAALQAFADGIGEMTQNIDTLLDPTEAASLQESIATHVGHGVPATLAKQIAAAPRLLSALDIAEVAATLQRKVATVARIYFALGTKLDLNWLRDHIAKLNVDTRWTRLAQTGLRDDLYRIHRSLTREALLLSPTSDDGAAIFEQWTTSNAVHIERYLQQRNEFKVSETPDLALLTVAVSEARKLIVTAAATPTN